MDVAGAQSVNGKDDAFGIGGHGCGHDFELSFVGFGSAVAAFEFVGVGFAGVVGGIAGFGGVNGLGESKFESVWLRLDGMDFEGDFAGPAEALDAPRTIASPAPAGVGLANEEGVVFAEADADDAALEAFAEGDAGALPVAVYFFQHNAHDAGVMLIGDKELIGEGAEASFGQVPFYPAGAFAHFVVGKPNGGHFEVRILPAHVFHKSAGDGLRKVVEGSSGEVFGDEAMRMAVIIAKFEVGEFGGIAPLALVVGVKHIAPRTVFDAGGRTQPGGNGEHFAGFGVDADGPASPMGASVGFAAEGFVGDDPKKPFRAEPGAEVVFVVVAADFPIIANGLEKVALIVAVDVFHSGELAALRGVNPAFVF